MCMQLKGDFLASLWGLKVTVASSVFKRIESSLCALLETLVFCIGNPLKEIYHVFEFKV
jgi:hypothetical protein